ncbi:hypothetical protein GCM10010269_82670 [Streptomyces humidus]|uniref:Uncharacterized protein n=1 Tax=Streptomyces humidus TaxID=52259 RepID=A0A918GF02_9ACTN|nr:hypothetical protein [Streptomyces humidus]GGS31673.1 hypothetical protein GCM10010269_82670 [Streptomyces humidus]
MADEPEPDERTAGAVTVTVGGEVMVMRYDDLIDDGVEIPLYCPVCGRTAGITLHAEGRTARLACPCGHAWSDPAVAACGVRQLLHLRGDRFPGTRVRAVLLPRIEEPTEPERPTSEPPTSLLKWEDLVLRNFGRPALTGCLDAAAGLTSWALPTDGLLYERLYPPAGGNAVDAHMTVVSVALALYRAGYGHGVARPTDVRLDDVAALLRPGSEAALRGLRPAGLPGVGGQLRLTDAHRLRTASDRVWSRWMWAARRVVALNTTVAEAPAGTVAERHPYLPDIAAGSVWYQPVSEPPNVGSIRGR